MTLSWYILPDVWLQLTSTCPVIVDARSRDLLVDAERADERTTTNYDDLFSDDMVTHKQMFNGTIISYS